MSGTRDDWAKLLPLIQAFVAGEPVQRMGFRGRWNDATELHSLLAGGRYRLKPAEMREGVWTRNYSIRQLGNIDGATGDGTFTWEGNDTDTPQWPSIPGLTYTSEPVFAPKEQTP